MFVRDNMTKDPVCITPDQTISQVVDLMSEKKLHRLPVVQGKRIVGLVTEGTISASGASKATSLSIYELNYLLSKTTVDTIMIRNVVTIQEDAQERHRLSAGRGCQRRDQRDPDPERRIQCLSGDPRLP